MKRRLVDVGLLGLALVCGLIYLTQPWLKPLTKTIPVVCLALWVVWPATRYRVWIAAGLLLSGTGDLLLDLGSGLFLPGVAAFLLAHVAYLVAFVGAYRKPHPLLVVVFLAWCGGALAFVWPNLGAMAGPVLVYVTVIGAMMWRAVALLFDRQTPRIVAWSAAVGALMFGMSDTLLAFGRWGGPIKPCALSIMLLYWGGQFGIAISAYCASRLPRQSLDPAYSRHK